MANLATEADVEALLGTSVDSTQCAAMLAAASAKFRREARNEFTQTSSTVTLRVAGQRVSLPKRPVTAVTSVAAIDTDGTVGAAYSDWSFDGIDTIRLGDQTMVINATLNNAETVSVTYTHGFATIPDDVKYSVAQMVARAISSPTATGVTQESIGAYQYTVGAYAASGAMGMTKEEMAIAHFYRAKFSNLNSVYT